MKLKNIINLKLHKRIYLLILVVSFLAYPLITKFLITSAAPNPIITLQEKTYLNEIISKIKAEDKKLNILEITPSESMSKLGLLIGNTDCINYLEDNAEKFYNATGPYLTLKSYLSDYGYSFEKYGSNYVLNNEKNFLYKTFKDYSKELDGNINLNIKSANEVTIEDVNNADMIVVTSLLSETETETGAYDFYNLLRRGSISNNPAIGYEKQSDGSYTTVSNTLVTYGNYIKNSDNTYSFMDVSWEVAKRIVEYNKTEEKPVVLETNITSSTDLNIGKMMYIIRYLTKNQTDNILTMLSTTYNSNGIKNYINDGGVITPAFNKDKIFDSESDVRFSKDSVLSVYPSGTDFITSFPEETNILSNYFWSYNKSDALTAGQYTTEISTYETENRVENDKKNPSGFIGYLLGAKKTTLKKYKNKVKILEIQPCASFIYNKSDNKSDNEQDTPDPFEEAQKIAKHLRMDTSKWSTNENSVDYYKNFLEVTSLSTSAFNGTSYDLVANYDLIIMGIEDKILNKNSSGSTVYNDTSLNGYIYLAFGDLVKVSSTLLGYLKDDYREVSAANIDTNLAIGTDTSIRDTNAMLLTDRVYLTNNKLWTPYLQSVLTNNKYYVLKNVFETFYDKVSTNAALYSNELGNTRLSGNDITIKKKEQIIYFAKQANRPVILAEDLYYLNDSKVYETSNVYKLLEEITTYDNVKSFADIEQLYGLVDTGKPEVVIKKQPTPITYNAEGRVDNYLVNEAASPSRNLQYVFDIFGKANGRYAIKVVLDKNGDGEYNSSFTDDDANEVFTTLYVNLNDKGEYLDYLINIELPENYNGLVAWELQVYEARIENGITIDSKNKTSIYGQTAIRGVQKQIKVLQIIPIGNDPKKVVTLNMETNADFNNLLNSASSVIEYDINIKTVTTQQFENYFNPSKGGKIFTGYATVSDYLTANDYDMLVIGFADLFLGDDISNHNGAVDCINEYINNGNAVLFTHDTISYTASVNHVTGTTTKSVYTPDLLKKIDGMYHPDLIKIIKDKDKNKPDPKTVDNGGNRWVADMTRVLRNTVGMDRYNVTQLDEDREVLKIPKKLDNSLIKEIQGLNNMVIYRYAYIRKFLSGLDSSSTLYTYYPYNTNYNGKTNNYSSLFTTTKVEKLNDGQITSYPYLVDNDLTVATTHAQWYQIDLEDKDTVVWYTLSDDGLEATNSGYYGDSLKDAANNYYIYSKGNITYSGAGHSTMNSKEELKLFVNTIIKAITAGNYIPDIKVNNASLDVHNNYAFRVNELDDMYDIDFEANDKDLLSLDTTKDVAKVGKFKEGRIIWVKNDGTEVVLNTYKESSGNALLNGIETTFRIDGVLKDQIDAELSAFNRVNLRFEAVDMYNARGIKNLYIVPRELFLLD